MHALNRSSDGDAWRGSYSRACRLDVAKYICDIPLLVRGTACGAPTHQLFRIYTRTLSLIRRSETVIRRCD
jgi:hypothetical protein